MKESQLPKDQTQKPGYPSRIDQGSTSPEGYQREARGDKPSSAGTKLPGPFSKRGK